MAWASPNIHHLRTSNCPNRRACVSKLIGAWLMMMRWVIEVPPVGEAIKRSPERHLPPVRGGSMDPIPAANPMTPEGYIEGFGNFARGLKRIFGRRRHK